MPSSFTDMQTTEEKATEYKAMPGQFNIDEALGIVECFVAGIGNKDSVGDVCLPGAFSGSLKRRKPRVVWGHNWNEPIGKVLDIYEVGPNDPRLPMKMKRGGIGGLYARVQFNLKSERGKEAFNSVVFFGEEQEWSIGYKTLDAVFDPSQQANMLKEVELYEVSPVLHGANQLTGTISIKADQQLKDPKGGLTPAGRKYFKETEGANLKPGVKGPADTPEKMRRKGSFLTRFYTNPSGPLVDEDGEPTRLALAAVAWGEPAPKNREDAAELAAKGRRMLNRYGKNKTKSDPVENDGAAEKGVIYESPESMSNTSVGRMADLAKALSERFSSPVKIRTADRDMVIFDISNGGQSTTMRVTYYFDGDEFMFGEPHQVRAETVYLPVNTPAGIMPGHAFPDMEDDEDERQYAHGHREMMEDIEKKPHGGCGCGGTCGTSMPSINWSKFKEQTPGAHLFVRALGDEKSAAMELVKTVCDYHGIELKELEDGVAVPFIDSLSEDGYEAVMNIAQNMSEGFSAKGAGGKLRRIGQMGANRMARFDPNARDADGDRVIQEGTTFQRPDAPKAPQMMPKVKPIQVPRREDVPIKPSTPSPSTPAPTRVPVKPKKAPAYAKRRAGISGAMSDGSSFYSENRPGELKNWESAAIEEMVRRTGLPRELFDSLTMTERIGNPEDTFYQSQDFNLSEGKIQGLQDQLAKLRRDYYNAEMDDNRMGGDTDRPGRLSGAVSIMPKNTTVTAEQREEIRKEIQKIEKLHNNVRENPGSALDAVLDTKDGDEAWDLSANIADTSFDDLSLSEAEDALDNLRTRWQELVRGMNNEWNDGMADRLTWQDEEGLAKLLMREEDMSPSKAKKEAERLQNLWVVANQTEETYNVLKRNIKAHIQSIEDGDDDEEDY
jgi:HK97 family phage prohead protease